MDAYIPDSILLNNIYIPFYVPPTKKIYNAKDHFTLELDSNGIYSIINLTNNVPYIDYSRIDNETKDWFWYTSEGFPFRIERNSDGIRWQLTSIYNIGDYSTVKLIFNPKIQSYDSYGKELGFYSVVSSQIDSLGVETALDINVYNGKQIIFEIAGNILTDQTNYFNIQEESTLTNLNPDINKEYYYNFNLNKIYTNQNLSLYDASQIKIYTYSVTNSVDIKCRLKSNYGMNNYITPVVDYYIAKLHGQLFKG